MINLFFFFFFRNLWFRNVTQNARDVHCQDNVWLHHSFSFPLLLPLVGFGFPNSWNVFIDIYSYFCVFFSFLEVCGGTMGTLTDSMEACKCPHAREPHSNL